MYTVYTDLPGVIAPGNSRAVSVRGENESAAEPDSLERKPENSDAAPGPWFGLDTGSWFGEFMLSQNDARDGRQGQGQGKIKQDGMIIPQPEILPGPMPSSGEVAVEISGTTAAGVFNPLINMIDAFECLTRPQPSSSWELDIEETRPHPSSNWELDIEETRPQPSSSLELDIAEPPAPTDSYLLNANDDLSTPRPASGLASTLDYKRMLADIARLSDRLGVCVCSFRSPPDFLPNRWALQVAEC